MRITESQLRRIVRESLKKDIERHALARQIYTIILDEMTQGADTARPVKKDIGRYTETVLGGGTVTLLEVLGDATTTAEVDVSKLPEELQKALPGLSHIRISFSDKLPGKIGGGVYYHTYGSATAIKIRVKKEEIDPSAPGAMSSKVPRLVASALENYKSVIIHELAHMIDDLHLMGQEKFRRRRKIEIDPETGFEKAGKGYYNVGLEVNARWAQVIEELNPLPYTEYDPEDDSEFERVWLDAGKDAIRFDELAPQKQRKFVLRLWDFYKSGPHEMPDWRAERAAKALVKMFKEHTKKLMDKRLYSPREYARRTMEMLGTWQGYFEYVLQFEVLSGGLIKDPETGFSLSDKNTKKILRVAEELSKPAEKDFEWEFSGVAEDYPEDLS